MTNAAVDFLKHIDVFRSIPDSKLVELASCLTEKSFQEGEVLCEEGDHDPWVYFIRSGTCLAQKRTDSDETVTLRVIQPFEIMGLTSAFSSRTRSVTLIAGEGLSIYALSHKDFERILFTGGNEATRAILEHLSANLRKKNRRVARLLNRAEVSRRPSVAVFDSKEYTQKTFEAVAGSKLNLHYFESRLGPNTAALAEGFSVVVCFVNDDLSRNTLSKLAEGGVKLVALRCAGFNNVDRAAAKELGIMVTRVPAYSPHAVAEHSLALIMTLNRKTHRAYNRVKEGNFTLNGMVGFDLYNQTVGVIGTGKIGQCMVRILIGLGCEVIAYDPFPNEEIEKLPRVRYSTLEEIYKKAKIISLYAPLTKDTFHMINAKAISKMRDGVMIINTSRGGLIDSQALIAGLKSGRIGSAGLNVYEEESEYFFEDFSGRMINDDVLARLLTFNNVLVTSHQAFLTEQALNNIAQSTFNSINEFLSGKTNLTNAVDLEG